MELLQYCYKSNDKELRQLLVAKPSLCPTHSIFGLAKLADHEDFIAHTSSQGILNEIWSGAIKQADLFSLKVWCLEVKGSIPRFVTFLVFKCLLQTNESVTEEIYRTIWVVTLRGPWAAYNRVPEVYAWVNLSF